MKAEKTNFNSTVRLNSPAADADAGRRLITSFGGTRLNPANLQRTVGRYKPGEFAWRWSSCAAGKINRFTVIMGPPLLFNFGCEAMANAARKRKRCERRG